MRSRARQYADAMLPGTVLVLGLLTSACGDVRYVDPAVDFGDQSIYEPMGDPTLALGFYDEQLLTPFEDGSEVRIIFGRQGGTWVMPAVRAQGVEPDIYVEASLVTDEGEVLGEVSADQTLVLAADGWLELQILPIPARHAAPRERDPIDDLYGVGATLSVSIEDGAGRSAELALAITLVQE